jgi:hypothetical protein
LTEQSIWRSELVEIDEFCCGKGLQGVTEILKKFPIDVDTIFGTVKSLGFHQVMILRVTYVNLLIDAQKKNIPHPNAKWEAS